MLDVTIHRNGDLYIPRALVERLTQGKPTQMTIHAHNTDTKRPDISGLMMIEAGSHPRRLGSDFPISFVRSVRWRSGAAYIDFPNDLHRWLDIPLRPEEPVRFDWQMVMEQGRQFLCIDGIRPTATAVEPEIQPDPACESIEPGSPELDIYALQLTTQELKRRVATAEERADCQLGSISGLELRMDQAERARMALSDKVDSINYRDDIEGLEDRVKKLIDEQAGRVDDLQRNRKELWKSVQESEKDLKELTRRLDVLEALDRRPWWRRLLCSIFGGE